MCKEAYKEIARDLMIDILQEAKGKGFTLEDLAQLTGTSYHSLKHYFYEDRIPPFSVVLALLFIIKPEKALKRIAERIGYLIVKLPEINTKSFPIISKQTAEILKEYSEYMESIADAMKDGKITKAEAERIKKEGLEVIIKIFEMVYTTERIAA